MKWFFLGVLGLAIVLLTIQSVFDLSLPSGAGKSDPVAAAPKDDMPDMRVQGVVVMEQEAAGKAQSWELSADEIAYFDERRLAHVKVLRAELFPPDLEPIRLTAERGSVDSSTGDMTVEGDVLLRPLWGYDLETAVLHWDAANRTLHTEAEVRISAESVDISGTGFSGSVDQQHYTLKRGVKVSFRHQGLTRSR
ncbi:MAG: LPS export ABC transporter periplasmic protein LptC [Candidatus Tectomicrobia bacterium]|nr:LPS export ABC transporter periplasmic protein LptC [Candidatus Tectomicrobia bacterium]